MSGNRGNHGPYDGSSKQPANPIIDLKVILTKDEVAYLFGFDGVLLAQLGTQTNANVGITDGDSQEYVLCVGGTLDVIFKAFSLVCRKLWDFLTGIAGPNHNQPLNLRLAVPSSQCGSIIGKQGSKVKEIRDLTGANIQVSQESLPDSTERAVDISGSGEACLQSTYHICVIMQETPLRGEIVPYIPPKRGHPFQNQGGLDMWRPVFLCGDRAYIIDGNVARPCPPELLRQELAKTAMGGEVAANLAMMQASIVENGPKNGAADQAPASNLGSAEHMNPLALISAISRRNGSSNQAQTSREMSISKDLVMIVGAKVEEIQRMSGAQIHVSGSDDDGPGDRILTFSGTEESILLAQFLIQSNIDLVMKQGGVSGGGGGGGGFGQGMMPNPNLGGHAFENVQQGSGNSRFNDRRMGNRQGGGGGGRNQGRKSPGARTGGRSRGGRR